MGKKEVGINTERHKLRTVSCKCTVGQRYTGVETMVKTKTDKRAQMCKWHAVNIINVKSASSFQSLVDQVDGEKLMALQLLTISERLVAVSYQSIDRYDIEYSSGSGKLLYSLSRQGASKIEFSTLRRLSACQIKIYTTKRVDSQTTDLAEDA